MAMPKLREGDSARLSIVRFPLILLVLYIHSFIAPVNFAGRSVQLQVPFGLTLLCEVLSNGIARVAVPLFFLMSGISSSSASTAARPAMAASCARAWARC